jgi:hypothetical protein
MVRKHFIVWLFAALMFSSAANALGMRAHLWIAQRVIEDLATNCKVTIKNAKFDVTPELCQSIKSNPGAFLAGAIGPDGYPDFITGQITTHPGIVGDWQAADWFNDLYQKASPGSELAFAAGYITHGAGDAFAHSYVNAYAGDNFLLTDGEVSVERRHFVLEKYIDFHLPEGEPDPDSMTVPAAFLSRELIFSDVAARTGLKSGALHIAAMQTVRTQVIALDDKLRGLEGDAANSLAGLVADSIDLGAKAASGETALETASKGLQVEEANLKAQKQLLDGTQKLFNDAADAVDRNHALIIGSEAQSQAAQAAIDGAHHAINEASKLQNQLNGQLISLQQQVSNMVASGANQSCSLVQQACSVCSKYIPGCNVVCPAAQSVCTATAAFTQITNQISSLQSQLAQAQADIQQGGADIAANTAKQAVALQAKAQAEAAQAALQATRQATQASLDLARAGYDAQLKLTQTARQEVDKLTARLATLRKQLADTTGIRDAIADLVKGVKPLSFYTSNWRTGIDLAGEKYIEASLASTKGLVKGSGAIAPYQNWLGCYGGAFTPIPYQLPVVNCQVQAFYKDVSTQVQQLTQRVLPEPFATLYRRYFEIEAQITGQLKDAAEDASLQLVKIVAPDPTTADFIALLVKPENATREKLTEVFATTGDSGGKDILAFPDVAPEIDKDIHLTNDKVDPDKFLVMQYGLTLAKLSLLDKAGLQAVVRRFGGDPALLKMGDHARYSILLDTLRSLDGNQQWQPYGLPYARTSSAPTPEPAKRHYGYGPQDADAHGFPLFIDPALRRDVFLYLFPAPYGGEILKRPELSAPRYPFPTCAANPFPVAFNPDGSPAASDLTCATVSNPARPRGSPLGVIILRWWRLFFH